MISIVDIGMGNLGSIENMLKRIGAPFNLVSTPESLATATKIILPGVGAFDQGMGQLERLGLADILRQLVGVRKLPMLGICLGMQLMTRRSEEGTATGLGLINAETRRFRFTDKSLKIPHMGWNTVTFKKESKMMHGFPAEPRFYFVHSYHVCCDNQEDILISATHGYEFVAGFERENIVGVQFHPEKSHRFGIQLFRNFAGA